VFIWNEIVFLYDLFDPKEASGRAIKGSSYSNSTVDHLEPKWNEKPHKAEKSHKNFFPISFSSHHSLRLVVSYLFYFYIFFDEDGPISIVSSEVRERKANEIKIKMFHHRIHHKMEGKHN
jgi:hypothetical protein